jgi:membrane-anchored glycerophosphoryl diester phosphodiesterase (GDPDase)
VVVPVGLIAALTLSWYYGKQYVSELGSWLLVVVWGLLFTLLAVACHRLVLLGSEPAKVSFAPRWSWRESKFFAWWVAVYLVHLAAWYVFFTLLSTVLLNVWRPSDGVFPTWTEWMSEAAKILALYVSARLSLVFPATAIDKRPDLKWSWNLTRNNGWRMVVVVGVLPWVIGMIVGVLYRENATVLETIVLSTLGIALFAVEIAALSLSYRELTKEPEAPG